MHEAFDRFAKWCSWLAEWCAWVAGHPVTIALVIALSLAWLVWGVMVQFNEAWHEWGVTPMTWVTFFLLFPILFKQNQGEATIVAHVKELAEDLPDVDEHRARERAKEECE